MKEITTTVLSTEGLPICVDCRFASVSYWYPRKPKPDEIDWVGCTKVVGGARDIVSGTDSTKDCIDARMCRYSESLCRIEGRWFETKA